MNRDDREALAIVVMAIVYAAGAYLVALIVSLFFYAMSPDTTEHWNWGTVFRISFWVYAAMVTIGALFLAYQWAANVLDNPNPNRKETH